MLVTKLSEKFAPIKIEQTTLYKFCPDLPEPKTRDLLVQLSKKEAISNDSYTLSIEAANIIEIQETHCFKCGTRLKKNGFNDRIAILDEGFGRYEFRIHRKHCRNCGEITPDYSKLAPKYGNYHENYKRRARQHYMEGLMPSQIKRAFKIDFGIDISKSSIINWVNKVAKPLREMLKKTPVPSSGHWGYDEIHMRIGGEKMYTIDTVDVNTKFIPVAKISPNMGRAREERC